MPRSGESQPCLFTAIWNGGTLYLRPYMIGVGDNIGVAPAKEYIFLFLRAGWFVF